MAYSVSSKDKKIAIRRIVYINYEIPTNSECEMHLEVQRKLDLGRLKITQLESNLFIHLEILDQKKYISKHIVNRNVG